MHMKSILRKKIDKKLSNSVPMIKLFYLSLICLLMFLCALSDKKAPKAASPLIILSDYSKSMDIGDEFYLKAVTSDLSFPKFKSSGSAIASVDAYGLVTAKKAGTCKITVKSGSSETYCQIQVRKTTVTLSKTRISLEKGQTFDLSVTTSNGHIPTYKCSKKSIALVTEQGKITALKPGEAVITIKADQTEAHFYLTVKKPVITLNHTSVTLYRSQSIQLTAKVSSGITPVWKTNKKSVVAVEPDGNITALKHGTALVTATVDGVKKSCNIIVKSPVIKLSKTSLKLSTGSRYNLTASVSSGNAPVWTSSKSIVASVDQNGTVTAKKKGTAIIKVREDGTTASCTILVQ